MKRTPSVWVVEESVGTKWWTTTRCADTEHEAIDAFNESPRTPLDHLRVAEYRRVKPKRKRAKRGA